MTVRRILGKLLIWIGLKTAPRCELAGCSRLATTQWFGRELCTDHYMESVGEYRSTGRVSLVVGDD